MSTGGSLRFFGDPQPTAVRSVKIPLSIHAQKLVHLSLQARFLLRIHREILACGTYTSSIGREKAWPGDTGNDSGFQHVAVGQQNSTSIFPKEGHFLETLFEAKKVFEATFFWTPNIRHHPSLGTTTSAFQQVATPSFMFSSNILPVEPCISFQDLESPRDRFQSGQHNKKYHQNTPPKAFKKGQR